VVADPDSSADPISQFVTPASHSSETTMNNAHTQPSNNNLTTQSNGDLEACAINDLPFNPMDDIDWLSDFNQISASWTMPETMDYHNGTSTHPDTELVSDLLRDSFDMWP